jgi:segregation and condensation protein B
MHLETLKKIIEGLLFAANEPVSIERLAKILGEEKSFNLKELRTVLNDLANDYIGRGLELKEVASGFRFQVREELSPWLQKLWAEKPQRYSRAVLEVLALIAYKQPVTRPEIEEIRGVTLSTNMIRSLEEREWITVVGHKDVPGHPALYATTAKFLDYFNLKNLSELPTPPKVEELVDARQLVKEEPTTEIATTELELPAINAEENPVSSDMEINDENEDADEKKLTANSIEESDTGIN